MEPLEPLEPLEAVKAFYEALFSWVEKYDTMDMIVDIKTFTWKSLLIFISTAYKLRGSINSNKFLYDPAKSMSNEWLTKGVSDFRSILGLLKPFSENTPYYGFDWFWLALSLCIRLRRSKSASSYISIEVRDEKSSVKSEYYRKSRAFVGDLIVIYVDKVRTLSFSLLDPSSCTESIVRHMNLMPKSDVVIAPMSNKISASGAALVGLWYKYI